MREGEYTSAYEQQRYNDLPEFSFRTDEELAKLGLERVDVGEELRKYEKLFSKDMGDGTMVSTGYVFEIFRKIKAL